MFSSMVAYPISVKGVVVDHDRVLLLLNERDEWDPESLREQPFDMARTQRSFHDAAVRSGERG